MRNIWLGSVILVLMVFSASWAMAQEAKPGEGLYFRLVTHGGDDPFWAVVQREPTMRLKSWDVG